MTVCSWCNRPLLNAGICCCANNTSSFVPGRCAFPSVPHPLTHALQPQHVRVRGFLGNQQATKRLVSERTRTGALEADLLESAQATAPATYLQLVGQALICHARRTLPLLLTLPAAPAAGGWLDVLYARPFGATVALVSQVVAPSRVRGVSSR